MAHRPQAQLGLIGTGEVDEELLFEGFIKRFAAAERHVLAVVHGAAVEFVQPADQPEFLLRVNGVPELREQSFLPALELSGSFGEAHVLPQRFVPRGRQLARVGRLKFPQGGFGFNTRCTGPATSARPAPV